MATRIEKRTLRDRVNALRTNVYRLYRTTDFGHHPIGGRSIARFNMYLRQTKHLAALIHKLRPNDISWQYYDKDIERIDDYLYYDKGGSFRGSYEIRPHAVGALHQALDNLLGAVSRVKAKDVIDINELAGRVKYSGPIARAEARAVLADLLEEKGYEGEANTLRSTDKWSVIKKVLISLGIEVPGYEPYYKVDRDKSLSARRRRRK